MPSQAAGSFFGSEWPPRKWSWTSLVATLGAPGREGDGVRVNDPSALASDLDGNLIVADTGNHRILKLDRQARPLWTLGRSGVQVLKVLLK